MLIKLIDEQILLMIKNFPLEIIIVDDGSDQENKTLLMNYINEINPMGIQYYYKKNSGKFSSISFGLTKSTGEFFMDMDDDDSFIVKNFEDLLKNLESCPKEILGFIFQTMDGNNKIIGSKFSACDKPISILSLRADKNIKGDKKEIIKTEILKSLKIPVFQEKRTPTSLRWTYLSEIGKVKCSNIPVIHKNYLIHGLTKNILIKKIKNPKSIKHLYRKQISLYKSIYNSKKYLIKAKINFYRYSFHSKKVELIRPTDVFFLIVGLIFSVFDVLRINLKMK